MSISTQGICYNASMIIQGCAFVDNVAPGDVIVAEIDYLHRLVLTLQLFCVIGVVASVHSIEAK